MRKILIDELRKLNTSEHYAITEHARICLQERGISLDDVMNCVSNGEIIEQYETDKPLSSYLVFPVRVFLGQDGILGISIIVLRLGRE